MNLSPPFIRWIVTLSLIVGAAPAVAQKTQDPVFSSQAQDAEKKLRATATLQKGDWKFVESLETGKAALFNLKDDPKESRNLANQDPQRVTAMKADLARWRESNGVKPPEKTLDLPDDGGGAVRQSADGSFLLHARDVEIHGVNVRYEPQPHKNTVGYWTKLEDWISWDFIVDKPGVFRVHILQGCGKGNGGSEVEFAVDGQSLMVTVQDTGGFQNFVPRDIGQVKIESKGRHTLTVKPKKKPGFAVMDLRQITLTPAAANESAAGSK